MRKLFIAGAAFGGIVFVAAGAGVRYAWNEAQRSLGWK